MTVIHTLAMALAVLMLLASSLGAVQLGPGKVLRLALSALPGLGNLQRSADALDRQILFQLRLPRIFLSVFVGAALAVAGAIFQGLFRNPMADPYILGTSTGAALGATIAYVLGFSGGFLGLGAVTIAAFVGALLTTALVYNLARLGTRTPLTILLLAGIAVSFFLSAMIALVMILHRQEMYRIMLWLMGGFTAARPVHLVVVLPYVAVGLVAALAHARDLNALVLGEEKAHQLGIDTGRLQIRLVLIASLLVTAAVSISGVIGFVGLVVPHLVRIVTGPDHRILIPVSALSGGILLLLADTAARTVFSPLELPVGIITSLVGAPFFLYLLRQSKHAAAPGGV